MTRMAKIERRTGETEIELSLTLDGTGLIDISTGVGFFDHMATALGRHGGFDLTIRASGDLEVDQHHTIEDIGICLGLAMREALGDCAGIRRYGHFTLPMDESLVTTAVDFGGRPFFHFDVEFPSSKVGQFDSELIGEFWQAFAMNAPCNLHILLHHGDNTHHIAEAVFKATARALRMAVEADPRMRDIPSTKGVL